MWTFVSSSLAPTFVRWLSIPKSSYSWMNRGNREPRVWRMWTQRNRSFAANREQWELDKPICLWFSWCRKSSPNKYPVRWSCRPLLTSRMDIFSAEWTFQLQRRTWCLCARDDSTKMGKIYEWKFKINTRNFFINLNYFTHRLPSA